MAEDVWSPGVALGSTDWSGGSAPGGGVHTGSSTVTMVDGQQFLVASSSAEVQQIVNSAPPTPAGDSQWVSFDLPGSASRVVLDVRRMLVVESGAGRTTFSH